MALFGIDNAPQAAPLFRMAGSEQSARPATNPGEETGGETPSAKSGTSVMAGHFVHAFRQESEYITGLKAGLSAQNAMMTRMQSVITGTRSVIDLTANAMALQGKEMTYAQQILLGEKAADDIGDIVDDEVKRTTGEKIEEIREDIEEKAEEAVAPESQEALDNDATPQEALEDSLNEAAPEAQAAAGSQDAVAGDEPNAEPIAAAPEDSVGREPVTPQESPEGTPVLPSVDLIV